MNLRQALEKFEKERESARDYYCVGYSDRNGYHSLSGSQYRELMDADVVRYEPFEGSSTDFSIDSMEFGLASKCRAVSIELDYDQVAIVFPWLRLKEKPAKRRFRW